MDLDQYQKIALDGFDARNHVAILGAAGSGKSHVLVKIIDKANAKYGAGCSVACAWTNNAGRNISGITLHKLFGAKVNWEWAGEGLWSQIQRERKVLESLLKLKVLIIDEVFTIKSNVFDAIDFVLRRIVKVSWHEGLPLGGPLLVVSGDPFQLEPIFPRYEKKARTVIHSSPWYHCFGNDACGVIVILPDNHRQASDPCFFSIMSRMRVGLQTSQDLKKLNTTSAAIPHAPETHTRLVLTNEEAGQINAEVLNKIGCEHSVSLAYDRVLATSELQRKEVIDRLDQAAPEMVITKIGARVLLTRKREDFYPGTDLLVTDIRQYHLNGGRHPTISLVCVPHVSVDALAFAHETPSMTLVPMRTPVHSICGELLGYREQLPIVPAYAITVHRSQSLSLQFVAINFSAEINNRWNPYGKVCVALCRCTTLKGLWVRGLGNDHISISPSAQKLMGEIELLKREIPHRVICKISLPRLSVGTQVLRIHSSGTVRARSGQNIMQSRTTKKLRLDEEKENITYKLRDASSDRELR